jgi:6-pyruvoyltetrahydropterin/6-carboxytetrahydropterin synthase
MILSATDRESLHGHDYQVNVAFDYTIENNGMAFDVRLYKQRLRELCQQLDYRLLLPSRSDFLRLEDAGQHWIAHVNGETMTFLKKDVVVLPITNLTLEDLSDWFLQQLLQNPEELHQHRIDALTVRVFNGRGESGATHWKLATIAPATPQTASLSENQPA